MSVWGILRVKDEADVIAETAARLRHQVDHLLVEDNASTDGTVDILSALDVELLHDPEVGYYQSAAMTRLAKYAGDCGATWVIAADGDEVWLSGEGGRIADLLPQLPDECLVAEAHVFDHVATAKSIAYSMLSPYRRDEALPLRKVACRPRGDLTILQGNHGATYDRDQHPLTVTGRLQVRHFPHRTPEQMIRKARNGSAAYAATDLPEDVGAHWRGWGNLTDEQLREVFFTYYFAEDPDAQGLVHDPLPALPCLSRS